MLQLILALVVLALLIRGLAMGIVYAMLVIPVLFAAAVLFRVFKTPRETGESQPAFWLRMLLVPFLVCSSLMALSVPLQPLAQRIAYAESYDKVTDYAALVEKESYAEALAEVPQLSEDDPYHSRVQELTFKANRGLIEKAKEAAQASEYEKAVGFLSHVKMLGAMSDERDQLLAAWAEPLAAERKRRERAERLRRIADFEAFQAELSAATDEFEHLMKGLDIDGNVGRMYLSFQDTRDALMDLERSVNRIQTHSEYQSQARRALSGAIVQLAATCDIGMKLMRKQDVGLLSDYRENWQTTSSLLHEAARCMILAKVEVY